MIDLPVEAEQRDTEADASAGDKTETDKDAKIAELEALLALQNQQRGDKKDKSKKEQEKRNIAEHPAASAVAKIVIEHTNEIIEYDAEHDRVLTKNEEELNRLMERKTKKRR